MRSDRRSLNSVRALERVREEITFIRDELEAFDEFERRVDEIICLPNFSKKPLKSLQAFRSGSETRVEHRFKQAYESTVMSTPHYESEYGDSYLESIRVEFDPGTVQILTGDISYSSLAKKRVIEASVRAQKERSAYLDELRSEESNLRGALSRMENWLDEIKRIEARPVCRDLDTYSNSLSTLSEIRQECDRLASLRQESIRQVQPVSIGWDRSTYIMQFIYSSEPFQNPILSDIGFIGKLLEEAEKEFGASNWP